MREGDFFFFFFKNFFWSMDLYIKIVERANFFFFLSNGLNLNVDIY